MKAPLTVWGKFCTAFGHARVLPFPQQSVRVMRSGGLIAGHTADQELLAQQQSAKHALYDQEEQKIIVALADRDLAVKEREAAVQSRGQEQRNKIEESAREFTMHQTRQFTVSNLEHEIKQESIQILKLLQSVHHEVCIFFCASALYSRSTVLTFRIAFRWCLAHACTSSGV